MQRTVVATVLFAAFAAGVASLLAWLSFRAVGGALAGEFETRLVGLAGTLASQVSPADLADARLLGEDGPGYANLQVLLEELRAAAGAANVTAIDSSGVVLYDGRSREAQFQPAVLDPGARQAFDRARRGEIAVSPIFRSDGEPVRVAMASVLGDAQRVAGVVAIEARVDYLPAVADFGRSLGLVTGVVLFALGVLAALVVRTAWSSAQLERRLSRSESLAAMGRLTATLAHEIKNPLAVIRGSAQRLAGLDAEGERMRGYIVDETDRLGRTVGRYLQFARGGNAAPEAGGDAVAALRATLDLLEGELRARAVTVRIEPADGTAAPVALDEESLKQVYLNLILNAVEAMPAGGELRVTRAERTGHVEIAIADDGPGIPRDVLERIGNPFYSTKAQGTGLGLFLSRRLVQAAGGELRVTSQLGQGTTCTVRLPRRRGSA